MVNDPIALSLEKRKLWRRAATRWTDLLTSRELTTSEMEWVLSRKEYCLRKVQRTEQGSDASGLRGKDTFILSGYRAKLIN
ncbi:transcriptional activator [Klebsiella phage KpCHEMY26]|uniref:Transcriptional regulator n=1 Tax=Klebsiella phage KpCHEMY26 TaxID=2596966 RepID=A0A5B8R721_9CAUD|nr:transcriptional activator [Klebsiella phage KpCHEMY26]QEA03357.1 transcriptional regulator [Klebsiella phage KpCHEMY26]